jgi:hypothetical protein
LYTKQNHNIAKINWPLQLKEGIHILLHVLLQR